MLLCSLVGIEFDICSKVAVVESRVELEAERNKESGERELDWTTTLESSVKKTPQEEGDF